MAKVKTTASVQAGDFTGATPEFGRVADVTRIYGIKRGTLYNLLADGKVKGCLLRVRGQKSGVRLFHLDSVRELIRQQMANEILSPAVCAELVRELEGGTK